MYQVGESAHRGDARPGRHRHARGSGQQGVQVVFERFARPPHIASNTLYTWSFLCIRRVFGSFAHHRAKALQAAVLFAIAAVSVV